MIKIRNKKSQIHMMETMAVLFVFFVLAGIGFLFYIKVMKGNVESEMEVIRQLQAIEIAQRTVFLPELQCSEGEDIVKSGCIDVEMLEAFRGSGMAAANQVYYHNRLGFSEITINQIYPPATGTSTWSLYDKPLDEFSDKIITFLPISLKYPKEDYYSFGIVKVSVYMK